MAKTLDRYQPTLYEFPIQNNRTGWHPVWTPTLLVVPWSYDTNGYRIPNSQIKSITFFIEKMIQIEVAGHPQNYDPIGPKPKASPDKILFEVTLNYDQLFQYRVETGEATFYKPDGSQTETPEEGDQLEFINSRGITGRVEYLPDAEYFDLSLIEIPVDNLASGRYIASWTVEYNERISTNTALYCISDVIQSIKLDYPINHPGEIHNEMVKITPAVYFDNIDKKQDSTVNLYRPIADVLQDVFDETELFYGINWISKIPPQLFPYLSYLIGVELPTQSGGQDLDKIRRRMIERGVELQKLKGSEIAIKELFLILGFTIEIINLWASIDGNRFIAPNEPDPEPRIYPREEIKSTPVEQTDPLLADYGTSGFGDVEIPLLYHNTSGNVVISAFLVNNDAYTKLIDITNSYISDPNYLTSTQIIRGPDGYLKLPQEILDVLSMDGVKAYSRLVVSDIEVLAQQHQGLPIIRFDGIKYDRLRDKLNITFADYKDLSKNKIFIYATYVRDMIEVPDFLKNNLSNRFDVKIISKSGEIESSLYDYLIDSLFKFKAFHSLLRKVSYDAPLRDFYNVTDFCANSYLSGTHDSTVNSLSCPPACPITECFKDGECNARNARGGLRQNDYNNNNIMLDGLKEEYDRWHDVTNTWLDIAAHKQSEIEKARLTSNVNIPIPDSEGDSFGQDRVSYDFVVTSNNKINGLVNYEMIYKGTYLEGVHNAGTEPIILTMIPVKYQVLSDIVGSIVFVSFVKEIKPDLYYVTMQIDVDHQKDVRSKITDLDRLNSPDYCYKGRVRDFMSLENNIELKTTVRNRPCNLMMGTGVYYRLDVGRLDNKTGWYNDLLKKSDQTLHYSNDDFFENVYHGSPLRPSLNIEKIDQGFPGHRSIKAGLTHSFTHPDYNAKPWDYSDNCFEFLNPLNAKLIKESEIDGTINERLIFDVDNLTYSPDFITPDIDNYSGMTSTVMTHSIFSTAEDRPYVEFDNIVYTTTEMINTDDPIFNSAYQCETSAYTDYTDGYPAATGDMQFNAEDVWSQREIDGNIVIEADIPPGLFTASATYSSEVRVGEEPESITLKTYNEYDLWKGYRFDCDCAKACGPDKNCNLDFFEKDGQYDFNNDHIEMKTAASLIERVAACGNFFNGEIKDFLNWDFGEETGTHEFRYKDEYDIEYKVSFTGDSNSTDITCETFQPRIWGENSSGYITDGKVFRKGILSTVRQIFILEDGEWKLSAEGDKQDVVFRQTNYDCDNRPPEKEEFTHHFEYEIYDKVNMVIKHGPHWTDPIDPNDLSCVWGSATDPESSFGFINAWG